MSLFAYNNRTSISATIKRASARARTLMNRFDRESLKELELIYRRAINDIQLSIHRYADSTGSVRLESLQQLLNQTENRLSQVSAARNELLKSGQSQAVQIAGQAFSGTMPEGFITRAANGALEHVRSFIASDGLQLSDRLWRLDNHASTIIKEAIENSVIQGHSASQAVNELLARGEKVTPDLLKKMGLSNTSAISKQINSLFTGTGNPRTNAMRLMRTELNRAHGEAYMATGENHPDLGGWKYLLSPRHPEADICDMHSKVNRYGLGPGVYPNRDRCPWPAHPNTLSYVEIVFKDEISDEDKKGKEDRIAWLNKQPGTVQYGVLNSRAKRAALQKGILRESEIATPWNVLKKKYLKRGIDVSDMFPKPTANFRDIPLDDLRLEAYEYVVAKGEKTGWEHAVIYDVASRNEFIRKTSRSTNSVSFDKYDFAVLSNIRNRLEVVHNHPSSRSLSLADLRLGTLNGVETVVAIGHNGTIYRAKSLVGVQIITDAYERANRYTYNKINPLYDKKILTVKQAEALHAHVVNSILNKTDIIQYSVTNISGELSDVLATIDSEIVENMIEAGSLDVINEVLR